MEKELVYGLKVMKEDSHSLLDVYVRLFKHKYIRDSVFKNSLSRAKWEDAEYLEHGSEFISYWDKGDIKTIIEKVEIDVEIDSLAIIV